MYPIIITLYFVIVTCELLTAILLFNAHTSSEILFIRVAESMTYSLHDFVSRQDEAMSRARQQLKKLREEIVTVIVSVCQVHLCT